MSNDTYIWQTKLIYQIAINIMTLLLKLKSK